MRHAMPAAGREYRLNGLIAAVNKGSAHDGVGQEYHGKAKYMVERKKSKQLAAPAFNKRDIRVYLPGLVEAHDLPGYGLGIIKENAGAAGRAGGAQSDVLAPSLLAALTALKQFGRVNEFERAALHWPCGNIAGRAGLGQKAVQLPGPGGRVQQQRDLAGHEDAPEEHRPVHAGVIDQADDFAGGSFLFHNAAGRKGHIDIFPVRPADNVVVFVADLGSCIVGVLLHQVEHPTEGRILPERL